MNLEEFRNLDLAEISTWPRPAKWLVWSMLVLLVWFIAYRMAVAPSLARLETARKQESQLKQDVEQKQSMAANLETHRARMQGVTQVFGAMLGQLPGESEVAGLLEDISRTGRENGLEFQYFKPEPEVKKGFFVELPIHIRVAGNYHQFGHFISDLAELPRIVTVHQIHISHNDKAGGKPLQMELVARTYRSESPSTDDETADAKGGKP